MMWIVHMCYIVVCQYVLYYVFHMCYVNMCYVNMCYVSMCYINMCYNVLCQHVLYCVMSTRVMMCDSPKYCVRHDLQFANAW